MNERELYRHEREARLACAKIMRQAFFAYDNAINNMPDVPPDIAAEFASRKAAAADWFVGCLQMLEEFRPETVEEYARRVYN